MNLKDNTPTQHFNTKFIKSSLTLNLLKLFTKCNNRWYPTPKTHEFYKQYMHVNNSNETTYIETL